MSTAQISTVIQPLAPRGEFRNEPFMEFHDSENVHAMQAALTRVGDMLGHEYELVIGGERSRTASKIESLNPARPAQVVGVHQKAGAEHVEETMAAALGAFVTLSKVSTAERVSLVLNAAALIRERVIMGLERAKRQGKQLGRPRAIVDSAKATELRG